MVSVLGNIRLTFAIAAMAVCSIAIAIGAVLLGLFISLSNTASTDAVNEVASATRISSEILQVNLPSLEIASDEVGNVAALTMRSMPRFRSHDVIDTVARVSGQNAAIYVYNTEVGPDLNIGTSSLLKADGQRLLDAPILAGTPLFDSMMANQPVHSEENINGVGYFTLYQPIAMADGTVIGALMIAVARAPIEAVVGQNLIMLVAVGGAALLLIGLLALALSRLLTRPIPRLSDVMSAVAQGDHGVDVPYTERRNEIGAMARAVEVFRANAERVAELGEETSRHLREAADHTGQLDAISMSQIVVEFSTSGDVLAANENFLTLLGYRLTEIIGHPNAQFLFDTDPASPGYRQFWLDLAAGKFKSGEYRRRTSDGREVWIQSTFTPILGLDGAPYKVVQFATDVTARRQAVAAVGAGLKQLAEGDLTGQIEIQFQPEFEDLRHALNGTVTRFADVVGQLRTTSRALKAATGEILSGANDLSDRTTRQASTIVETTAAMGTLAGTVASNARMAQDAAGKASAVSRSAAESGTVMARANDAMERITQSSSKISNIIGLIDDIAFQTNLLALNASVEAARAGDAGKGFAVVAVEVRRLAQSAASASADVKLLVEQSASEVKNGSQLVSDAAGRLSDMQVAVEQNSALVEAIARASGEQASAIDEVLVSVRQLDEMTQHNAALAEETNAALEQTEAQAQTLDMIVDVFVLEEPARVVSLNGRRVA
ncbi:methyl-accepting chemotaxis sensory transducer with Pas/Pac sensor [Devosia sp. YR412]|uniref:methyl-accepting chemotaxis protein n=1 Tax=Devosia sp. YR412 TaxID=1881030 RepID=UPI0008D69976|nr:methyl-accepting chemotaxis protein [Devosia sp. YR412]SEQ26141.1 methyl-accepting chemotaxis sensory transducer with Pas/Pac sensor [Devosia sp. YR412]